MFDFLKRLFSGDVSGHMLHVFDQQRQQLRDAFFQIASSTGKPRGLRWTKCDWLETRVVVFDSESRLYTAFCGINLSFEAIEGGDMEDVDAVSMIRDATAVFHGQEGRWGSGGKVLFNMTPTDAARMLADGQTVVDQQPAPAP